MKLNSRLDRNKKEFVLDIPLIGCPEAVFLGNLEFSLFLPEILKLQLKKPKKNETQTDELMDIFYDKKKKLLRVDNLKENYYEIADFEHKNFYHFQNDEQCTAFYYQSNYTKSIQFAKSFIDQIYSFQTNDFYHIGQKMLDGDIVAQVFERSKTTNKNKDVTTIFTKEVKSIFVLFV